MPPCTSSPPGSPSRSHPVWTVSAPTPRASFFPERGKGSSRRALTSRIKNTARQLKKVAAAPCIPSQGMSHRFSRTLAVAPTREVQKDAALFLVTT